LSEHVGKLMSAVCYSTSRKCTSCGCTRSLDEFPIKSAKSESKIRYGNQCKSCKARKARERRTQNTPIPCELTSNVPDYISEFKSNGVFRPNKILAARNKFTSPSRKDCTNVYETAEIEKAVNFFTCLRDLRDKGRLNGQLDW
jgi:hypothetical protein